MKDSSPIKGESPEALEECHQAASEMAEALQYCHKRMAQAYSEIARLEKQLEDYRRLSSKEDREWISVKERLPEVPGDFLTYNASGFRHVAYFSDGVFLYKPNKGISSVVAEGHRTVTHWQPLPSSPKEE